MSRLRIAAIVEGHGEEQAVPVLVRRLAEGAGFVGRVDVVATLRTPASKLAREGELERSVELAARRLGGPGGIVVILDCDDECPATLGPLLLARARRARSDLPVALVLARREFEAWFLGAAASLAGCRGLPEDLKPPASPESVQGCKEWLSDRMPRGRRYDEREDQPAFAASFDIDVARASCRSFDKCHWEIVGLLKRVAEITPDSDRQPDSE
jgi:hypothetical protein